MRYACRHMTTILLSSPNPPDRAIGHIVRAHHRHKARCVEDGRPVLPVLPASMTYPRKRFCGQSVSCSCFAGRSTARTWLLSDRSPRIRPIRYATTQARSRTAHVANFDDVLKRSRHGGRIENTVEIRILLDELGWERREGLIFSRCWVCPIPKRAGSVGAPSALFVPGWHALAIIHCRRSTAKPTLS